MNTYTNYYHNGMECGKVKILVVEDDPVIIESYRQMVTFLGYDLVGEAATCKEALEIANETEIDLVLMDIYLADGSSGLDTAEKIKSLRNVAIIFITIADEMEMLKGVQKAEAYGYLIKPVSHMELHAMIEITLNKHRLHCIMEKREQYYRGFLRNFRGIMFECRAHNSIPLFLHGLVESLTGYSEEEFTSGRVLFVHILHPDDQAVLQEDMDKLASTAGYSVDREFRIIRKDGFERWLRGGLHNVSDPRGQPEFIQAFFMDITEQKRVEEALRESDNRFRELYDHAPVGYHEINNEGMIVRVNQTELRMLGYRLEEMLGNPVWKFNVDEDLSQSSVLAKLTGRAPVGHPVERLYRRKDGFSMPVLVIDKLLYDANEKVTGIRTILEDITEKKKLEEERNRWNLHLQQVQQWKSLSMMAGKVAHEFNNILTGIIGYATLALKKTPPDTPVYRFLGKIETESLRAADLCRQMLTYSGKGVLEVKSIELSALIREMEPLIRTTVSKKVKIVYQLEEHLPEMTGDSVQLRHAIIHLVSNASDASVASSGTVKIRTGVVSAGKNFFQDAYLQENLAEGQYLFLSVEDEGVGMDADTIRRIFDPFYSTKEIGRGLGLAAVLGTVHAHKGAIKVQSIPRSGSVFTVYFPAKNEVPKEPLLPDSPHSSFKKVPRKILVVDDQEAVLEVNRSIFKQEGYETILASSGKEGLRMFQQNADEIGLVLLDMNMPDLNGVEVLKELRKIRPDLAVIIASGLSREETDRIFASFGHLEMIQKPYPIKGLISKVRQLLPLP